jgi:hypothetical protein
LLLLLLVQTSTAAEEEVEVFFEETEEIDRAELDDLPPLPEYHYSKWLLGLPLLAALVVAWNVRWRGGARRHQRTRDKKPSNKMRRTTLLSIGLALTFSSSTARAAKYMSLGEAVKTFIPKDAKIFKTTKQLSTQHKLRLSTDYGWSPEKNEYVFYVGKKGETPVAYVFVVPEVFNTCFHKYAVGMKPNGEVIETVIIELSCPRAFPVNKRSFLSQFDGKKHSDALATGHDIDAVTGATLSSAATASAARKAVSLHNLFFGGDQRVAVSADAKKARTEANQMIQEAIETGETLGDGSAQLPEKEPKK